MSTGSAWESTESSYEGLRQLGPRWSAIDGLLGQVEERIGFFAPGDCVGWLTADHLVVVESKGEGRYLAWRISRDRLLSSPAPADLRDRPANAQATGRWRRVEPAATTKDWTDRPGATAAMLRADGPPFTRVLQVSAQLAAHDLKDVGVMSTAAPGTKLSSPALRRVVDVPGDGVLEPPAATWVERRRQVAPWVGVIIAVAVSLVLVVGLAVVTLGWRQESPSGPGTTADAPAPPIVTPQGLRGAGAPDGDAPRPGEPVPGQPPPAAPPPTLTPPPATTVLPGGATPLAPGGGSTAIVGGASRTSAPAAPPVGTSGSSGTGPAPPPSEPTTSTTSVSVATSTPGDASGTPATSGDSPPAGGTTTTAEANSAPTADQALPGPQPLQPEASILSPSPTPASAAGSRWQCTFYLNFVSESSCYFPYGNQSDSCDVDLGGFTHTLLRTSKKAEGTSKCETKAKNEDLPSGKKTCMCSLLYR